MAQIPTVQNQVDPFLEVLRTPAWMLDEKTSKNSPGGPAHIKNPSTSKPVSSFQLVSDGMAQNFPSRKRPTQQQPAQPFDLKTPLLVGVHTHKSELDSSNLKNYITHAPNTTLQNPSSQFEKPPPKRIASTHHSTSQSQPV